jgi:lipopolysaccharide/colanic/teichoic acid biosynthesis glycosyltransferase/glycosyltransferase involved in cell wall biosynthesis
MTDPPRRLLHVTTIPMSLVFLRGQVDYMRQRGIDVAVLSSPGPDLDAFAREYNVAHFAVAMRREITPLHDLRALGRIHKVIRRLRPHIVHAHTPKGGLLGMLAATLGGVPHRVYHMRGLPLATANGWRRRILWITEWLACRLAHRVLCVSHSLRQLAVDARVCPAGKISVPLGGSGNGVDALGRFNSANLKPDARETTRARFGIPAEAHVIGFVGRLVRDKGIIELASAWQSLRADWPNVHLLLVGPIEPQDPIPATVHDALRHDDRVHFAGMDWNTPPLYAAMDVVALPTYREGFPNVPLEAAAMELPVVATRIPGCTDAIVDNATGILVPTHDSDALAAALERYIRQSALGGRHGEAGRERVLREFAQERLWECLYNEYGRMAASAVARRHPVARGVKRAMDILGAALGLVLLAPMLLLIAIIVRMTLGAPVLFRQIRPGKHAAPFTLFKFRTMREHSDAAGRSLPDADRLTSAGRLLRTWSIDELPQLWNVLKGDMSLVGPRPLLMDYLPLFTASQARRHDVRPGITGWAQVSGRNALTWDERLALDVRYVDHWSLALDVRILLRTVGTVFRRAGVAHPGHVTMERFGGTPT